MNVREILDATRGALVCGDAGREITGISTDTRSIKEGDIFLALKGENFDGHGFVEEAAGKGACGAIVGVNSKSQIPKFESQNFVLIQVEDTLRAYGAIARCHRMKFNIPFIGVTGSSGKTTTKEMVYKVLSSRFQVLKNEGTENNLIGLSRALLKLNTDYQIGVLELGTNHFGEIEELAGVLAPKTAVITNIGHSHLEFLKSKTGVLREKAQLLRGLGESDVALINADDPMLSRLKDLNCIQIRFGRDKKCDFRVANIMPDKDGISFTVNEKHNFKIKVLSNWYVYNALIAVIIGFLYEIDLKDIYRSLWEFQPQGGRLSLKKVGAIDVIDDTYNSNPQSLKAALEVMSKYKTAGRKIFVCGDMLELGKAAALFHAEAAKLVAYAGVNFLISVGNFREVVKEAAIANRMSKECVFSCKDNSEALQVLAKIIKEGDAVLLKGSRRMELEEVMNALPSIISAKRDMVRI